MSDNKEVKDEKETRIYTEAYRRAIRKYHNKPEVKAKKTKATLRYYYKNRAMFLEKNKMSARFRYECKRMGLIEV